MLVMNNTQVTKVKEIIDAVQKAVDHMISKVPGVTHEQKNELEAAFLEKFNEELSR